jgi:hypothetical protein
LIAAMLLASLVVGNACTSLGNRPSNVSLAQLTTNEDAYDGRDIITEGTVRQFEDPDGTVYDVIEDSRPNRVELKPASAASDYVGHQVELMGTFHFDDQDGRSITVERVKLVGG